MAGTGIKRHITPPSEAPAAPVNSVQVPPYAAYRTFKGFLEKLGRYPATKIDRSVMGSVSGSNQYQLLAALRYLGLISTNRSPTQSLSELLSATPPEFKIVLRRIIEASYAGILAGVDLSRVTLEEVEGRFIKAGARGDTVRKCVAFFLAAARDADMPISPYLRGIRLRRKLRTPAQQNGQREPVTMPQQLDQTNVGTDDGITRLLLAKFPEFDPQWPTPVKTKWFTAFDNLMKRITNGQG